MSIENNLRTWREDASLSREQLAERLGVSSVSIYRIENGQQQPRPALLAEIGRLFTKSPSEFYAGHPNVEPAEIGTRRVPILDFVTAGDFMEIKPYSDEETSYITTDLDPSPGSFALRLRGRSMEPDFREGDIVLIDPEVRPRAEDFVVAVDERGEGNFKRYHELGLNEHGQQVFELVSLNPAYPSWRSDRMGITIRGTMVEHRRFRHR